MAARAVASATISFGLVSIPVKLFTAASSDAVHFNMLDKRSGSRVKMQYVSAADGAVLERDDIMKGYEYARGQYVTFTEEELENLQAERKNSLEITEFVPLSSVDFVYVERSYYLGPDKGGDRAYRLLTECMREKSRVAVGQWAARGKEQLVLLRPYAEDALILHQLHYASEVRKIDEIDTGASFTFNEMERDLAHKLIDQLSVQAFDPSKYRDLYAERVKAIVEQKVAGQEISVAQEAPKAQIIDLFEALKRSLAAAPPAREAASDSGTAPRQAREPEPTRESAAAEKVADRPSVKKAAPRKPAQKKKASGA
jgi:DNA end-binding protein Ku